MSDPIPYAVIGVGGVGHLHAKLVAELPELELVAVVDLERGVAERVASEFGCEALRSVSELVSLGRTEAVSVAVPPDSHLEVGLACLGEGWHVMMEKPLELTGERARRLVRAAASNQLVLAVAHQYRLHAWAQKVKLLIDEGTIGEPLHVIWSLSEFRSERYFEDRAWRADTTYPACGILANQAVHALDVLVWMLGNPTEVVGQLGRQVHETGGSDVVMAQIRFESGCLASFTWSINAPRGCGFRLFAGTEGVIRMKSVRSVTSDVDDEVRVARYDVDVGQGVRELPAYEQPRLVWDESPLAGLFRLLYQGTQRRLRFPKRRIDQEAPHRELLSRFGAAIRGSGRPAVTAEEGLRVVVLMESIAASAATGKAVKLP